MERCAHQKTATGNFQSDFFFVLYLATLECILCLTLDEIRCFFSQWMTALQFLWPCLIFVTIYMLRLKFGAYDVEECQFPTRELPSSKSILPFFQSYICNIDNQCSSAKNYSETSTFDDAPYV